MNIRPYLALMVPIVALGAIGTGAQAQMLSCGGGALTIPYKIAWEKGPKLEVNDLIRAAKALKSKAPALDLDACLQNAERGLSIRYPRESLTIERALQSTRFECEKWELARSGNISLGSVFSCPREKTRFITIHLYPARAGKPARLESPQLNALLARLRKTPERDDFRCLTRLKSNIWRHLSENAYLSSAEAKMSRSELSLLVARALDEPVDQYGQDVLDHRAKKTGGSLNRKGTSSASQYSPKLVPKTRASISVSSTRAKRRDYSQSLAAKLGSGNCPDCGTRNNSETLPALNLPDPNLLSCTKLKDGESQIVDSSETSLLARYKLTHEGQGPDGKPDYKVAVNIAFHPDSGDPALVQLAKQRFSVCMKRFDGALNSPDGHLKIRLFDPTTDGRAPSAVTVNLSAQSMAREDMDDWSISTSCPIMLHETLHMLGLVDTYKETVAGVWTDPSGQSTRVDPDGRVMAQTDGSGNWEPAKFYQTVQQFKPAPGSHFSPASNCRAAGPADSIMTDPYAAEDAGLPSLALGRCVCELDSPHGCIAAVKSLRGVPDRCPSKSTKALGDLTIPVVDLSVNSNSRILYDRLYKPYLHGGYDPEDASYQFVKRLPPKKPSILYPAEFRVIAFPGCSAANKVYDECGRLAYVTSSSHDSGSQAVCPEIPQCMNPQEWEK